MTRFRKTFLDETRDTLNQLGLGGCPVCGSSDRGLLRLPVVLPLGGLPWSTRSRDDETNVLFAIALRCESCGNLTLFDSEAFRKSEPSLVEGLTEEEEDELEQRDG